MVFDAVGDDRGKERCQHLGTGILVVAVLGIVHGKRAEFGSEMADIMQKGCNDHLLALARLFGEVGALQHVFGHGDGFTEIFLIAATLEDVAKEGNDGLRRQAGFRRSLYAHSAASCISASSAASVE